MVHDLTLTEMKALEPKQRDMLIEDILQLDWEPFVVQLSRAIDPETKLGALFDLKHIAEH